MAPKCMSFSKTLPKSYVSPRYFFNVPKKFSKEHMPSNDCDFVLVGESERAFPVSFAHLREDQFTSGWKDFVIPRRIKVCITRASKGLKVEQPLDLLKAVFVRRKRTQRKPVATSEAAHNFEDISSFEDKGMAVGFLRAEIGSLVKLSHEHQTVEESSRTQHEALEREKNSLLMLKIDELILLSIEHGRQIEQLERKMVDLSDMMKAIQEN